MVPSRFDRYRSLFAQVGDGPARALIDRLQVVALRDPGTVREMEKFLDRGGTLGRVLAVHSVADRRQNPDRRRVSTTPPTERRLRARRASDVSWK